MRYGTLVLPVRCHEGCEQLLLGRKLTGEIGRGKYNAPGGKREAGETLVACAARELAEEVGLIVAEEDLNHVATLYCYVLGNLDFVVAVYRADAFQGAPAATASMSPEWFNLSELPFYRMHEGDSAWITDAARGRPLVASLFYNQPGEQLSHVALQYGDSAAPAPPSPKNETGRA